MRRRPPSQAVGRGLPSQAGSETLSFVLVAPAVFVLISLVFFAGRITTTTLNVSAASAAAARAASLAREPDAARAAATAAGYAALDRSSLRCRSSGVSVDTAGFSAGPGTGATASVTVRCTQPLGRLFPGLPGTRTFSSTARSPIDTYRER